MRAIFFSLALGAASALFLTSPGGQAAGDHDYRSGQGGKAKIHSPTRGQQTAILIPGARLHVDPYGTTSTEDKQTVVLDLQHPPTTPYRSAFFFPESARAERERKVELKDNYFSPSILWVPAGTKVKFTNGGRHTHTATCASIWESGDLKPGESFSLTFTRAGTYYYYCRHHPYRMSGTITVY